MQDFVEKIIELLRTGVHVLVIDLFPPTLRDPFGIHKAIWDEFEEKDIIFPAGKDRIVASYQSDAGQTAATDFLKMRYKPAAVTL